MVTEEANLKRVDEFIAIRFIESTRVIISLLFAGGDSGELKDDLKKLCMERLNCLSYI